MTKNIDELLAILRRAEERDRRAAVDAGAESLGDLFEQDRARKLKAFSADSAGARDKLRSEADGLRHQDLELQRQLQGDLDPADEAERAALSARPTETGYYRPVAESGDIE